MISTLIAITTCAIVLNGVLSDSNNESTNDNKNESNCYERAEEETRKALSSITSRSQLERFMKHNYMNPDEYKDYSIESIKRIIIEKARMRGRSYRDFL